MILSHLSYFLVWIEEYVYKTSTWLLGTNEYIYPLSLTAIACRFLMFCFDRQEIKHGIKKCDQE